MADLAGVFFGRDAIGAEFQSQTGHVVVGHPTRRSSTHEGKWIVAFIHSLVL